MPALTSCPCGCPQGVRTPLLPFLGCAGAVPLSPSLFQPMVAAEGEISWEMCCCCCAGPWGVCGLPVGCPQSLVWCPCSCSSPSSSLELGWGVVPALAPSTACHGDPRLVLCLGMVPGSQGQLPMSLLPGHGSFPGFGPGPAVQSCRCWALGVQSMHSSCWLCRAQVCTALGLSGPRAGSGLL